MVPGTGTDIVFLFGGRRRHREGRFLKFSPQALKGVKLWHWEQARHPWLLLRCLAALKGACLCQAMEKQTQQRCLNLDISRSVSEEIKPVSLKEPRTSIIMPGRRRAGLGALFLRPSPGASDKGAARPGAPRGCLRPGAPRPLWPPGGARPGRGCGAGEQRGREGRPGPGPAGGTAARVFPLN